MKYATFKLDRGDIKFRLYSETPIQVNRFIENSSAGKFKGTTFYRVEPGFVVQSGPTAGANETPLWDEIKPPRRSKDNNFHAYGVLSAANAGGEHSSMGAFFICLSRIHTMHLDPGHTTFGHVIEGIELIEQIKLNEVIHDIIISES